MDDDVAGCLASIFGIGLAVVAAFYAAWIALAAIVRALAVVVVVLLVVMVLSAVAGLLMGLYLPLAVLNGRSPSSPAVADPDMVRAGKAFGGEARGESRHFGWDHAWPTYLPYQARRDARAVTASSQQNLSTVWGAVSGALGKAVLLAMPAIAFYAAGLFFANGLWFVVMAVLGAAAAAGRFVVLMVLRGVDRITLKRRKATLRCPECSNETSLPGFRCGGASCRTVHRDIRPGALGVIARRCGCGERLPTSVTLAARQLTAVCPICDGDQSEGAGARQVVTVVVIGERTTGKTRLLAASSVGLRELLDRAGGSLEGLTPDSVQNLRQFAELIESGASAAATSVRRVTQLLLAPPKGRPIELQLYDVAGETFSDWESTAEERYLAHESPALFLIDPLAIPTVQRRAKRTPEGLTTLVAAGRFMETYSAVADHLRSIGVDLRKRKLGVVITKADELRRISDYRHLDAASSKVLRAWLLTVGQDLLVNRLEQDFGSVTYFLCDAQTEHDPTSALHPSRALSWVVSAAGLKDSWTPVAVGGEPS